MKNLSIIVAAANLNVIGINNTLPWHLPEDLKRFRALTTGHHIIMGRKTYESLGRLLPNRTTVIVTRNPNYQIEGALMANSLEAAIGLCASDNEPFLIGGAELYKTGLAFANKLYLTKIHGDYAGDAFFPDFLGLTSVDQAWQLIDTESHINTEGLAYSYLCYTRLPSQASLQPDSLLA